MTLSLREVTVALPRQGRLRPVVDSVSLTVAPGAAVALVGESGSGKTTVALAIPRLLPPRATIGGQIHLQGQDLASLGPRALRRLCGARIGFVFQDPLAALNPARTIGAQIAEPIRLHQRATRRAAWDRAVSLLDEVGISHAAARAGDYPHMFSGGMRQRATIAAALACDPALLIADEPTAGLDAPLASQILDLLARLRASRGMALLLISHDLPLVARHADYVAVLYAGRCVERGPAADLLADSRHRYTRALIASLPRLGGGAPTPIQGALPEPEDWPSGCRFRPRCAEARLACAAAQPDLPAGDHAAACLFPGDGPVPPTPIVRLAAPARADLLRLTGVEVVHRGRPAPSVQGIDLCLASGECLAIAGPSGAGKTSLAHAILGLLPHRGQVTLAGAPVTRATRRQIQLVFQNPMASLDPTQTAGAAIAEALHLARAPVSTASVAALLAQVGLPAALMPRRPATLSGGQAQRLAIARALAAAPALLVLDEPTASLDVSNAAALLALLRDLAARNGLGYIVITHDLAVAVALAHRLAIMNEGRIVETGDTAEVIRNPVHACTRALVAAASRAA